MLGVLINIARTYQFRRSTPLVAEVDMIPIVVPHIVKDFDLEGATSLAVATPIHKNIEAEVY